MIFLVILVIALSIAILIGIWHIRIAILKAITKITKKIISVSTPSSISNNCRERLQSINNSRITYEHNKCHYCRDIG
ncbi:putative translocon-associated protein, alpha subunit [Schistosoma mansoni]|uniref:putative translocon-associated protein, alpha subunit n=1 Tax=Schistosoma mansoni TaxID=6183 RepID=UPI00022DCA95|nr:putative translocon-associated protein, alpha subunit [Schistosoma mansoni]|eukprot:XP_018655361.1 putative translocon-associated protein, alpha subunit [Schistosoma mansoni]